MVTRLRMAMARVPVRTLKPQQQEVSHGILPSLQDSFPTDARLHTSQLTVRPEKVNLSICCERFSYCYTEAAQLSCQYSDCLTSHDSQHCIVITFYQHNL